MDLRSPIPWLAALPLILGGLMLPWAWGAAVHPGMQLGRGAGVLLLVGCLLALARSGRLSWHWRSPQLWLALALLWQFMALVGWAVVREPGLLWWGERAAALLTAIGVALWTRGQPSERLLVAAASVGAGCLVLGGLLLAGLVATIIPLWQRRAEAVPRALLIAWAGVLTAAMIESHLGQPGPLVLLALLAGLTWGQTQRISRSENRAQQGAALLIAVLCCAQLVREFTDGGSPTMIEFRAGARLAAAPDQQRAAEIAAEVRGRLGGLANWLTVEAIARAKAKEFETAEELTLAQLSRLPVDPDALDLALRLRDRHRRRDEPSPALEAALEQARSNGTRLLQTVPATPKTATIRLRLAELYQRI